MGITGLLPFLEKATRPCNVSEFRGGTAAIDGYCWLHKGASACAIQLSQGEHTTVYINYCMKLIQMLLSYDIKPILVFDGKNLPAKSQTEAKRRECRAKAKQRAAELLRLGKTDDARSYLKQSVDVTPEMAVNVIKECQKIGVDCIVAPYESDAQLAYFSIKGIAHVVITEDSDLILFGCTKVIYKMDTSGYGQLVDAEKIPNAMNLSPSKYTFDKFRFMCILAGCDYIDSLPGIGLKKAKKFVTLTNETDPEKSLRNVPRYLNMRHLHVTDEYKENFMVALATFRHQIVFDPFKRKLVPLTDPSACGTNPKYCCNAGEIIDSEKAYQIALGNLHPTKHIVLNDWSPEKCSLPSSSIWAGIFEQRRTRKQQQYKYFFSVKKKGDMSVPMETETKDIELIKSEEETQINKELEFYSKKHEKTVVEMEVDEERTSPILSQGMKKISKFPRTQLENPNVKVISRYFSKNKTTKCVESETSTELNETCQVECYRTANCDENNKIIAVENTSESLTIITSNSDNDCSEISSSIKRKKLGPCRTIGLKRSRPVNGQTTIEQLFNKFRKKTPHKL